MFELDIEMLKEQGLQLVDSAKKTAQDLADKGKNKLDLLNQQARLSKAQRQLGALVYSLHKAGEENPALVEKYINAVAEVEKALEEIKANMKKPPRARKPLRKSLSTCAVRQRSARSARPKWTATRCSAPTAALSCKPRKTTRQRGFCADRAANT